MNYLSPLYQFGFQDAGSLMMEEILDLHDFVNFLMLYVITLVGYIMFSMLTNKTINRKFLESQKLEFLWTLFPALILLQIAIPSIITLYMMDETAETNLTIKAIAHQWYWSYEYTDFWSTQTNECLEYDSYMLAETNMKDEGLRLSDVDNRLIVPYDINVRMIITSSDVLHSWAIPALGVKVDAVPGRLNQTQFVCVRPGYFFGYCSEICGANHSFMPISLEAVNTNTFMMWVMAQLNDL